MMRSLTAAALAAATFALPLAAFAGNGNAHGKGHAAAGCPPGLAKKHDACIPPGHAKRHDDRVYHARYSRGDHITAGYILLQNPARYGLDPDGSYYQVGDEVYRVDNETRQVLAVIGLISALAN